MPICPALALDDLTVVTLARYTIFAFCLDSSFSTARLPSWAGQVGGQPKRKALKNPTGAKAQESATGAPKSSRSSGSKAASKDPELEKIAIERNALLTSRRWAAAVKALNTEVASTSEAASSVPDASELAAIMESRFKKFVAMAPEVVFSPGKKRCVEDNHQALRATLSPISSGKVSQLEAPSKKGLTEYDKSMTSLESSVRKAAKLCREHIDKHKLEEAKENARQERLQKQRDREEAKRMKALQKAEADGKAEADKALAREEGGDDEAALDDEPYESEPWKIVQSAGEILTKNLLNVQICARLSLAFCFYI